MKLKKEQVKNFNLLHCRSDKSGFAVMLIIIIIGAAALIMAYSSSILGIGEMELGYHLQKGSESFAIADGCMEEAFRRLGRDGDYSGGVLSLGQGSCIITVSSSGSDRTVNIVGSVGDYSKEIESNITLTGSGIIVNSWTEPS